MYVLQISDLHITPESDIEELKAKIEHLGEKLKKLLPKESQMVCCLLGDFVDQGNAALFSLAEKIILKLKMQLLQIINEDRFAIEVIPGNHDLCTESENDKQTLYAFNEFASKLLGYAVKFSDQCSIYESDHFGYHFICASSVLHAETKFGALSFDALEKCSSNHRTIMLTHHALVSGDQEDTAAIRDGYQLQQYLEDSKVISLLHGHTHGCKRYTVGHNCQVIGVGPMFKEVHDVSNQCNLITISGSTVNKIRNLSYHGDRVAWDVTTTYEKTQDNNYYGKSIKNVSSQILNDTKGNPPLPNLRIQINQSFNSFEKEIFDNFSLYKDDALAWQSFDCPEFLDYTHGELMNEGNKRWYDFVTDALMNNPTNKRTIIPLIDKRMVYQAGDNKLVSFDVIQFGFPSHNCNDLHITVYLRALEVQHFLPINLYEIYLMAKEIRKKIRTIDQVTICLFAFRAEAKPYYGCYKKAKIDLLSESRLCKLISEGDLHEISTLLTEKAIMGDTVIDDIWIRWLKNAVNDFYYCDNRENVLHQIDVTKKELSILKDARAHCSDYSGTKEQEEKFRTELLMLASIMEE